MSDYLTADELASLVGCKPNQRTIMARWLDHNKWRWVPDRSGLPRVARAFHDKQMGITSGRKTLNSTPNLDAFSTSVGKNRGGPPVQTGR